MGSPFTMTLANIYMYEWEQSLIQHQQIRNELYDRYIDDIFMTSNESIENIKALLDQANEKDPNIRINYMIHESVEFLDVLIENVEGKLTTPVFRKPAAEPYIHPYTSDHPRHIHSNTINTALLRGIRICSDVHTFDHERLKIEMALLLNGYPPKFIKRMVALEQLMLMQDEIEQSQQIRAVADWDQEKLNEMNERKNWAQKQLNDFESTPTTEQDHLVEDEIEQLRQIDAVQKIQQEKRM
ncbi:unnamed protein product [Rotaria sordida]|uniref:Helix-turn-helix domain-containing protein n=1 Tax=Rotaria sordida TaxID=392033 RepID=A0A814UYD3_9BILA|nr:unnamed protein product [Rotaria sordida]CAF1441572.1 unnamed protein product [Rotaria sordida]